MAILVARYGTTGAGLEGRGAMGDDLLAGASWTCCATAPGEVSEPGQLEEDPRGWMAASVPGTAAGAVAAGSGWRAATGLDPDDSDWWFRCRVPAGGEGQWTARLRGPGHGGRRLVSG